MLHHALVVAAVIAGGRDHHDAFLDRALGGQREEIGVVRLVDARADRHVEDADVELALVSDGVVDRRNDVADASATVLVQNLEHHQSRPGGDAGARAVGVGAIAGDDAGDVRAVPVVVVRLRLAADEVHELIDTLRRGRVRVGEIVVPGGDAGIDHGDADPGAVISELLPHDIGADRGAGALVESEHEAIQGDALDERTGRQQSAPRRSGAGRRAR